ncbi:sporulation delaying protein family toxin [Salinithrix halophila]|uniref:Sporulation delaying protein family toxin n=1 Tax=Salinithrix halophila TaxID=1485204 RepID=A0ABV8JE40_9BACL
MKKLISYVVAGALLFVGLIPTARGESTNNPHYTGKEIFAGLVFAQGPVAKLFPEVWTDDVLEKAKDPKSTAFVNRLLDRIESKDPSYFNELQAAIQAKDHVKVDASLAKGGELLDQAMKEENATIVNVDNGTGNGRCAVAYAVAAIGAAVVYSHVAAVTVVAAGFAYLYAAAHTKVKVKSGAPGRDDEGYGDSLLREQYIDNIVTRLAY